MLIKKEANKEQLIKEIKDLYYEKGYSARRIGEFLNRSTDSVYSFMKRHKLLRRTSAETNGIIFNRKPLSYNLKESLDPEQEKLRIAGIMLYWAEGYKNKNKRGWGATIDLANSDPEMIKLFLKFLREICGINEDRLRVLIYCYANQNIDSLKKYWQRITGISKNQFSKPYVRQDFLREKKGKMKYGLVHIRYSDKKLFMQIKDWTKEYLNKTI